MSKFLNFAMNTRNVFDNDESKYLNFSRLLSHASTQNYESGITNADAMKLIRQNFFEVMGVSEGASQKEIRRAIRRNKQEIFEVLEDWVESLLQTGWENNTFFQMFVDFKNIEAGDANEFVVEDNTVLSVAKLSGGHWDIDRQRLGAGTPFRVPTYWVGLAVYEEFEKVMTGRADWAKLTQAVYKAIDAYVNEAIYDAIISAGQQVLPGSTQFYQTAVLSTATLDAFMEMCEDVQLANGGEEIAIMGTKASLAKLTKLIDVNWIADEDKTDVRNLGRVAIWNGIKLVEIPQVFKKNDTTTKLVDSDMLLVMPIGENKFIKFVYEGNAEIKEVTDNTVLQDMTYEFKYLTKLGVSVAIGRYFGTWHNVANH